VAKFGLVALCSTMAVGSVIPDRRRRSKFGVSEGCPAGSQTSDLAQSMMMQRMFGRLITGTH
jgi:hypothetical protein